MAVFQKQQLVIFLSIFFSQSICGLANGEPKNKKRRIEYSEQVAQEEAQQVQMAPTSAVENPDASSGERVQTLRIPLEALLGGMMMGKTDPETKGSPENIFDFYDYEAEENIDPYVGPEDVYVAGDLFVSMTKDWDSFSEHADMSILPLLIYGPKGFGKASLSHTLAAEAEISLFEFDFASKWQEEVSLEKFKIDTKIIEKMLSTASRYLAENPEKKLILLFKGFDPHIKLSSFFENPSVKSLVSRLFVIVNVDIDESRESKKAISKFEHFFDIEVKRYSEETHRLVLDKLLGSKLHGLSSDEVQKLANKTRFFSGDELNQVLRLASKNSLYRTRVPMSEIAYEDFESALTHDLFTHRHNVSHTMMYL